MSNGSPSWSGSASVDQAICGIVAGCVSTLVMHPLDLVKAKLQVLTTDKGSGLPRQLVRIARTDGLIGLYRGLGVNLIGNCSSWGLYFFWYSATKDKLREYYQTEELNAGQNLVASASSGIATAIFTNPIWILKSRAFTSSRSSGGEIYKGFMDGLYRIVKYEGVRGLSKGTIMSIIGVSNGAIQFMAYEELKKQARRRRIRKYGKTDGPVDLSNTEYVVTSGLAKGFAVAVTYPYQVVRTRLQYRAVIDASQLHALKASSKTVGPAAVADTQPSYSTIRQVLARTYRNEGFRGFYKGLGTNLIRIAPGASLTLLVYERMSIMLRDSADKR
ncbi:mitochondrial carrier [Cystobasidium minutum MCA 4210]|uniref:mitochondrial carrier n=1 Tax=Cystobasidium minutum MCA 4210 TaxID=1397322 RepID=UPI0034CD10F5|eukprot:jgi/Rhomi1/169582/fgenesh1_kg.3_\